MRRIGLAVVLALSLCLEPLAAQTQQVKIGVLCAGMCAFGHPQGFPPLIDALARVGLVQNRTLVWDIGGITGSEDQITIEAQKLVSRRPTLILVWGNVAAAQAAKDATRTIPIVLLAVPDVVEQGLVNSLGRPGSNITGTSVPTLDLILKQLQVLKEINTWLKTIVVVQGDLNRGDRQTMDRLRGAAASLRLDSGFSVTDVSNVQRALAAAPAGTSAVVAIGNISSTAHHQLRESAIERKLPLVMPWRASQGGGLSGTLLISYGPRFSALAERTAALIDRIVKGARPEDLPVEEPTSYELVIDGVMAKALGLTIPPGVRVRADEIIE
jgi:putative tryptophan/tyrosine transport system substrate-binding protein